ncbi:MAG: 4-hydroxy-3-methylbut-2-enyl diphosphate reductase, partial [Acholeplasmatales bacterium]|nr:4-hydroxy-3-methylbut-2-enyl diphosphate reductase [Acholeplasmatales bacterium]
MIINRIEPQGYCQGVTNALRIINEALKSNNNIYSLGSIIHNDHVINDLKKKGVTTIEEKGKSRLELLDKINEGTVVFSAHGVSPLVYEKAKSKNLNIIDATCPMVHLVHKKMIEHLNEGFDCIYIGAKGHPECEGVLGISDKIHFISNIDDIKLLNINNDKIYVTNQTTLSIYDILDLFKELKNKYPNIKIDDKICNATTIRQKALANQPKCDLCIIVGDKKSSNSLKLFKVSTLIAKVNTIFVDNVNSLNKDMFNGINVVNISSGASTPSIL